MKFEVGIEVSDIQNLIEKFASKQSQEQKTDDTIGISKPEDIPQHLNSCRNLRHFRRDLGIHQPRILAHAQLPISGRRVFRITRRNKIKSRSISWPFRLRPLQGGTY
jgi:hypothetical protein